MEEAEKLSQRSTYRACLKERVHMLDTCQENAACAAVTNLWTMMSPHTVVKSCIGFPKWSKMESI